MSKFPWFVASRAEFYCIIFEQRQISSQGRLDTNKQFSKQHTYFKKWAILFNVTLKECLCCLLSKSHAKFGHCKISRSPNSLCMGFTFLMDVNTSKYFLQLFYGNEANSNKPLKNKKNLWNWEISFTFSWYLKISLFTFTS